MSRRRPRISECESVQDFVRAGVLRPVQPSANSGFCAYGTGRYFLPGATNLVPDPQGVLADGTFWPADTAHTNTTANVAVPAPVPAALSGLTKCVSYVNDGTADAPVTANLTVSASTSYVTSFYVYAPTVGGNVVITAETGSTHALATVAAANTTWTRYSAVTATGVGQVTLNIKVSFAGGTASTIYITGAQVVAEAVCTPFFCGASTTGTPVAWTGTANASTSTRTTSVLRYANSQNGSNLISAAGVGTIACRVTPLHGGAYAPSEMFVAVHASGDTTKRRYAGYSASRFAAREYDGTNYPNANSADEMTFTAGTTHVYVSRHDGTNIKLRHDSTSRADVSDTATLTGLDTISIGQFDAVDTGWRYTGHVGPILISPEVKSDAWVTAITADSGAAPSSPMRLVRDFMVRGDLLIPLTDNSTAYLRVR